MKKLLTLILCLTLMAFAGAAFAESIEDMYDGAWVEFDDGLSVYLPADWLEIEVTEEALEAGIYYVVCSPDGAYTFQLAWSALETEMEIEAVQAELDAAYPGCELVDINGVGMVCFADGEGDVLGFAALDGAEPGMYMFLFTPGSDETLQQIASVIVTSATMTE